MNLQMEKVGDKTIVSSGDGLSIKDQLTLQMARSQEKLDKIAATIELQDKKIQSYADFVLLLTDYQKAVDTLRNPPITQSTVNTFGIRDIDAYTSNGSDPNLYIQATVSNNAMPATYTMSITNLATKKLQNSNSFTSSTANAVTGAANFFTAGTFQINGYDVTLANGDTLTDVMGKINALTSSTNVASSIKKVSDTNYNLTISSTQPGTSNAYTITDAFGVLSNITWSNTPAIDANLVFDNQPITRSTNEITDLLADNSLQITLGQQTPAGMTITINITPNLTEIMNNIEAFRIAHNKLMEFAYIQTEREQDFTLKKTAILGNETEFKNVITQINTTVMQRVAGIPAANIGCLADLGLVIREVSANQTTGQKAAKNTLQYGDQGSNTLATQLKKDYRAVQAIFEFTATSSPPKTMFRKHDSLNIPASISLDIDTSRALINVGGNNIQDKVRVTASGSTFRPNFLSNSKIIQGITGTPLEGIEIYYNGAGTDTINITTTQGIADKLYNIINGAISQTISVPFASTYDAEGNRQLADSSKTNYPARGSIITAARAINTEEMNNKNRQEELKKRFDNEAAAKLKELSRKQARLEALKDTQRQLEAQQKALDRK